MDNILLLEYVLAFGFAGYAIYVILTLRDRKSKGIKNGGFPDSALGMLILVWLGGGSAAFVMYVQPPVGPLAPYMRPAIIVIFGGLILWGTIGVLRTKSRPNNDPLDIR